LKKRKKFRKSQITPVRKSLVTIFKSFNADFRLEGAKMAASRTSRLRRTFQELEEQKESKR